MGIVLFSLVVTTGFGVLLGAQAPGNRRPALHALRIMFECLGCGIVFLCFNFIVGIAFVVVARNFMPGWLSFYDVTDTLLVSLSIVQGTTFQIWWRSADDG